MNGISGVTSSMHLASGSMATHNVGMQVAAHNIANISTDGFTPQRAEYATGANGVGVELQTVRKVEQPLGRGNPDIAASAPSMPERSGTELAYELPRMIATQRGFEAQAVTIRTADEMLGTLFNSRV